MSQANPPSDDIGVIPVVEEVLDVQKRRVETGGVRIIKIVHERGAQRTGSKFCRGRSFLPSCGTVRLCHVSPEPPHLRELLAIENNRAHTAVINA